MDIHRTRPSGSPDIRGDDDWSVIELARAIAARPEDEATVARRIYDWRAGARPKGSLLALERAFFGGHRKYDAWRDKLHKAARRPKDEGLSKPKLYRVPTSLPHFTGRTSYLTKLANFFAASPDKPWLAVCGMAGVGKTALVANFCRQKTFPFEQAWWCDASSGSKLVASLEGVGYSMGIPRPQGVPIEHYARMTLQEIAGKDHCLIYNDVFVPRDIEDFLPADETALIITSRISDWREWAEQIDLEEPPLEEAVALLLGECGGDDREAAKALALALGRLPLALSHAASTCKGLPISFADYAARLGRYIDSAPQSGRYPKSVFATINFAIDSIPNGDDTRQLIKALSFCSPDRIPSLLVEALSESQSNEKSAQALTDLMTFSLVKSEPFDDGPDGVIVHRLVREVGKTIAERDGSADAVAARVADCLQNLFPRSISEKDRRSWSWCEHLISHVVAVWNDDLHRPAPSDAWLSLVIAAGSYLQVQDDRKAARDMIRFAAAESMRLPVQKDAYRFIIHMEEATDYRDRDWEEGKRRHELVLKLLYSADVNEAIFIGHYWFELARARMLDDDKDVATAYFQEAILAYKEGKAVEPQRIGLCWAHIGVIQLTRGFIERGEEALKHAARFVSSKNTDKDKELLARIFDGKALLGYKEGRAEEAIELLRQAITVTADCEGDGALMALRVILLTGLLVDLGRPLEAQRAHEDALVLADKPGPTSYRKDVRLSAEAFFEKHRDLFRARAIVLAELEDSTREEGPRSAEAFWARTNAAVLSLAVDDVEDALRQCEAILLDGEAARACDTGVLRKAAAVYQRALTKLGRISEADEVARRHRLDPSDNGETLLAPTRWVRDRDEGRGLTWKSPRGAG